MKRRLIPWLFLLPFFACIPLTEGPRAPDLPDGAVSGSVDAAVPGTDAPSEQLPPGDPRGYVPERPFVSGRGRPFPEGMSRKPLGADVVFDPCPHQLPPLVHAKLTPLVDGSLADWREQGLVALDRRGDGVNGDPSRDLRALRVATDDSYLYLGVELYGLWPQSQSAQTRLVIVLQDLAERDDSTPDGDPRRRRLFLVQRSGALWEDRSQLDGKSGPVSADLGSSAIAGSTVELRLRRAALGELSSTYVIHVALWDQRGATAVNDNIGSYVVGYQADYTCLITLPDGAFQTSTMLRNPAVSFAQADPIYRAFIAAVPEVARLMGSRPRVNDTVNLLVVQHLLAGGVYDGLLGVMALPLLSEQPPPYTFGVMAHEAGHAYNFGDYGIRSLWAVEGHSEMLRLRALDAYFGAEVLADEVRMRRQIVKDAETQSGVVPLDLQPWPSDGYLRYSKAGLLLYGIAELVGMPTLTQALDPRSVEGVANFDSATLQARLAAALSARGITTTWQGFLFPGAYDGTPIPRPY